MSQNEPLICRNVMEDLVDQRIDTLLREMGVCNCEICKADIRAIALNNLPPRYVVSTSGGLYARVNALRTQSQADTIRAVANAVMIVSKAPRHDLDTRGRK